MLTALLLTLVTILSHYAVISIDLSLPPHCKVASNPSQPVTHLSLSGCATLANIPGSVEVQVLTRSDLAELQVEDISVLTRLRVLDLSSNKIEATALASLSLTMLPPLLSSLPRQSHSARGGSPGTSGALRSSDTPSFRAPE